MKTKEELLKEKQELERQIQVLEDIEEQKQIDRVKRNNELFIQAIKDSDWLKQYEHSRTRCSDNNVVNGFYSENYRCTKCALLEMIDGSELEDWIIQIDIVKR